MDFSVFCEEMVPKVAARLSQLGRLNQTELRSPIPKVIVKDHIIGIDDWPFADVEIAGCYDPDTREIELLQSVDDEYPTLSIKEWLVHELAHVYDTHTHSNFVPDDILRLFIPKELCSTKADNNVIDILQYLCDPREALAYRVASEFYPELSPTSVIRSIIPIEGKNPWDEHIVCAGEGIIVVSPILDMGISGPPMPIVDLQALVENGTTPTIWRDTPDGGWTCNDIPIGRPSTNHTKSDVLALLKRALQVLTTLVTPTEQQLKGN